MMVSRSGSKPMLTRSRSTSDLQSSSKGRPKRNVSPKNLDDLVSGLSWKEERELKRALYASLQEVRRPSRDDKLDDGDECESMTITPDPGSCHSESSQSPFKGPKFFDESSCSQDSSRSFTNGCSVDPSPKPSRNSVIPLKPFSNGIKDVTREQRKSRYHAQRKFAVNSFAGLRSESLRSRGSESSLLSLEKKIHAQRKFAQGSLPTTPSETPSKPKFKATPVRLFPVRPKTEDFLTYLCFRGTHILPPHLDLLNVTKEEYEPGMNGRAGFTRDSSPASSSSLSHMNEDSNDVPEMTLRSQTPNKKAARASASTPQTARGFSSLRRVDSKSSTLSSSRRKRLSDSYPGTSPLRKKSKGSGVDRLSLKRKAMATLTAARRTSKVNESKRRMKMSVSDGVLLKQRQNGRPNLRRGPSSKLRPQSVISKDRDKNRKSLNNTKGKALSSSSSSMSSSSSSSPSPKKRLKCIPSTRSRSLTSGTSCVNGNKKIRNSQRNVEDRLLETHPNKRLAVHGKPKKTFKPHRPMTRAASHIKSVLTAAKLAASRKMRLLKRQGNVSAAVSGSRNGKMDSTVDMIEQRKWQKKYSVDVEKSGSSSESCGSNSSLSISVHSDVKVGPFPTAVDSPAVVACPTYYPTEDQFRDPILYIQSIQHEAEPYGMCKIVPPSSWKMESRELEDLRFTPQTQYIHKMQHKWSPITEQLQYIRRLNENTGNQFHIPQIGGVEVDLVKLYELVQKHGGMKGTVGKEKKWQKIADSMKIPKQADRVSKLYAAYCKYLLAYETLSEEEQEKLVESVQADRQKHEKTRPGTLAGSCVRKGKSQLLSAFTKAARNVQLLHGHDDSSQPHANQIEGDYWEIVDRSDDHVSVQSATLDTSIYGSLFPVRRDNQYSRHGWNLHNLVESKGSVLHHLGLIAGVTVPSLHISMLYGTKCLSCNGHNLPTVQYLHQGADVIWYAVPKQETEHLKMALKQLVPAQVRDKGLLIQPDSLMVPPPTLVKKGVSLSRCVQSAREFVVVFPSVHYCNISAGYQLSESVHYGTTDWIPYGCKAAQELGQNHDTELFSMDAMLVFLATDVTTPETTLSLLLPHLEKVMDREIRERKKLVEAGLKESQRLMDKLTPRSAQMLPRPLPKSDDLEEIIICDISKKICYLSMVLNSHENSAFSLNQGLLHVQKKKNLKNCKLMYRYSEEELRNLVTDVRSRIKNGSASSSPVGRKLTRKSEAKSSPTAK